MRAYVYILQSQKDQKRYIGSTDDVDRRLEQHNGGYVLSTKNRRPFRLIHKISFATLAEARIMESKFKKSNDFLKRYLKHIEVNES